MNMHGWAFRFVLGAIGVSLGCTDEMPTNVACGCGDTIPIVVTSAGSGQTGVVGTLLADSLEIRVVTSTGVPVGGAMVNWTTHIPGGVVLPRQTFTNAQGVIRVAWQLGPQPGTQTVIASDGVLASPLTFTATAVLPAGQLPPDPTPSR